MEQNLNQYRIFYTVARHGNISRAANDLYISQPAVSKAIAKLEEEMGAALFIRNSRGVSLTGAGQILLAHLRTAFDAIALGEEEIRRIGALGVGSLKIGASATLCKYMLLPFLKGFIELHPHINITIESQSTFHTLKLLEERRIDIALVVRPAQSKAVLFDAIGDIHDIFVATSSYLEHLQLRESGRASTQEQLERYEQALFKSANLMLLDDQNVSRQYIDEYFKENGIVPEHILVANNMDLLIDFARIGLGVACVIEEFVREDLNSGRFAKIPLLRPVKSRTAGFAYLKNAQPTEPMKNFIDFYRGYRP